MAENNRPENIPQRKWQQITPDVLRWHIVEAHQDKAVGEEDRVIEKRLGQHQDETEKRATAMFVDDGVPYLAPRCVGARTDSGGPHVVWRQDTGRQGSLDSIENSFRFG